MSLRLPTTCRARHRAPIATSSAARETAGSACRKSFGSGYEGFELTFFIARAFD